MQKKIFKSNKWKQILENKITIKKGEINSIPSSISLLKGCDVMVVIMVRHI